MVKEMMRKQAISMNHRKEMNRKMKYLSVMYLILAIFIVSCQSTKTNTTLKSLTPKVLEKNGETSFFCPGNSRMDPLHFGKIILLNLLPQNCTKIQSAKYLVQTLLISWCKSWHFRTKSTNLRNPKWRFHQCSTHSFTNIRKNKTHQ